MKTRRTFLAACIAMMPVSLILVGCNKEILHLTSTEEKTPRLIGSTASPYGLEPLEVLGYGVVVGLQGTGGNVPQGAARSAALAMLTQQKMDKPSDFLASKDAAVVMVTCKVAAGARPGDLFDAEIRCLDEDRQTTSLRGGFLLLSSLKDVADISQLSEKGRDGGPNYQTGLEWAFANGPVMVTPGKEGEIRQGRVVAGARLKKERPLALLIHSEYTKKAQQAMLLSNAIDDRFRVQASGSFSKIADAKNAENVTLRVPDQYKLNVPRFLEVVGRIPHESGSTERLLWQRKCAEDLLNPGKCFEAALRLEALGGEVRDQLAKGCKQDNIKVRFASAEALAYLGVAGVAADTLAEIAQTSPELRPYALTALAVVDDGACAAKLRELMCGSSMETRYGAFVALRTSHPNDTSMKVFRAKEAGCCIYEVAPQSKPLVHLATSGKPEIVIFGKGHAMLAPFSLTVGPELVISAREGENECTISVTQTGGKVIKRRCSCELAEVLAHCTEMGASYADLVDMLRSASNGHNLSATLVIDGMPRLIPWNELAHANILVD